LIGIKVLEIVSTMIDITQSTRKRRIAWPKLRKVQYLTESAKHWKPWIL